MMMLLLLLLFHVLVRIKRSWLSKIAFRYIQANSFGVVTLFILQALAYFLFS